MKKVFSKTFFILIISLMFVVIGAGTALAASIMIMPEQGFRGILVALINNSFFGALLLTIGLAGILIDLFVSGFGAAGVIGILAFGLYFLGNIWAGHVSTAVIWLFVVGLLMLIAEIFITPGMGVLGIAGIAIILFSIFWAAPSVSYGVIALLVAIIGTALLLALSLKFGKTRKVWNKLILGIKEGNKEGYVAPDKDLAELVGARGKAISILRPAGTAEINGRKIDVVTEGDFIEAGSEIEVIMVEGLRVVVKKVEKSEAENAEAQKSGAE